MKPELVLERNRQADDALERLDRRGMDYDTVLPHWFESDFHDKIGEWPSYFVWVYGHKTTTERQGRPVGTPHPLTDAARKQLKEYQGAWRAERSR